MLGATLHRIYGKVPQKERRLQSKLRKERLSPI
jgi:hypothetical protein